MDVALAVYQSYRVTVRSEQLKEYRPAGGTSQLYSTQNALALMLALERSARIVVASDR